MSVAALFVCWGGDGGRCWSWRGDWRARQGVATAEIIFYLPFKTRSRSIGNAGDANICGRHEAPSQMKHPPLKVKSCFTVSFLLNSWSIFFNKVQEKCLPEKRREKGTDAPFSSHWTPLTRQTFREQPKKIPKNQKSPRTMQELNLSGSTPKAWETLGAWVMKNYISLSTSML